MSDYEGDWEPVASSVVASNPVIPPEPTNNYIVPKGTTLLQAQEAARQKPRRPKKTSAAVLPANYRPALQSLLARPTIHRNGYHPPAHHIPRKHIQARVLDLTAYEKYKTAQDSPDTWTTMMHSFGTLARFLRKHETLSPMEVAKDELARICLSTDAFIAAPDPEEYTFKIWGTPEQVERAVANLRAWEMHIKAPGKNGQKEKQWLKQNAVDGREEDRLLRKHLESHQAEMFKHFADETVFPYESHLIWPDGYDLPEFIDQYDSGVLDEMRRRFNCSITHTKEGVRATKVASENQQAVFLVYSRLLGLLKEMVARKKPGIRLVHCQVPAFTDCSERVTVKLDAATSIQTPWLSGRKLPESEAGKWDQLSTTTNKKYRLTTKTALRSCIKSLHMSRKHVRMRVAFGKIDLATYKVSANGQDFEIEEFITMLHDPGVVTRKQALLLGTDFAFLDNIESLRQFGQPDYSWVVHFEFAGSLSGTLRLEREYSYNPIDPEEPSVSATRWVEHDSDTKVLELTHLDLKKVGYVVNIEAASLYQNDRALASLRSFENNVDFKPAPGGLRHNSNKHSVFPLDNRDLQEVKEITIARYPFKDTKGTLEIRRIDTFPQSYGEASAVPTKTEWMADYYYGEWDNLMGQYANINPGQDVDWNRDVLTFFPKVVDEDYPKALPQGFKNFMKEVEEVQDLLTRALEQDRSHGQNGVGGPNGVNGHVGAERE